MEERSRSLSLRPPPTSLPRPLPRQALVWTPAPGSPDPPPHFLLFLSPTLLWCSGSTGPLRLQLLVSFFLCPPDQASVANSLIKGGAVRRGMCHILRLFETGDAGGPIPAARCLAALSAWEAFDTNKVSSLQNQEQMVLENEAPLRSIEPPTLPQPLPLPVTLPPHPISSPLLSVFSPCTLSPPFFPNMRYFLCQFAAGPFFPHTSSVLSLELIIRLFKKRISLSCFPLFARCHRSSDSVSFCSPGWSQQMAGLGFGPLVGISADSRETSPISLRRPSSACAASIHRKKNKSVPALTHA